MVLIENKKVIEEMLSSYKLKFIPTIKENDSYFPFKDFCFLLGNNASS
jgi:hypothetical protein